MLSHFSCVQLFATLVDCSPPGSSVHGILQARILEWVAMPSFRGSSPPRDRTHVSYISPALAVGSLPLVPPGKSEGLWKEAMRVILSRYGISFVLSGN